jgi:hypothetical protein
MRLQSKMEKNKELFESTTDNKTFKLCLYQHDDICCLNCARSRRKQTYYVNEDKSDGKFPSWKLVSKNKKQWMGKQLNYNPFAHWEGKDFISW